MPAPSGARPPGGPDAEAAPDAAADALVRPGERFGRTVRWSAAEIAAFATSVGDTNPLHHDAAFAATTRYRVPIASGTQTVSVLMGCFAAWFTRRDDGVARTAVGTDFRFRFVGPVRADDEVRLEWVVDAREWRPRHRGWIVVATGTATTPDGVALEAEGRGLVVPAL